MRPTLIACAAAVALTCAAPARAAAGDKKPDPAPTTAEAIRKALDQKITLDYLGQSLQETGDLSALITQTLRGMRVVRALDVLEREVAAARAESP